MNNVQGALFVQDIEIVFLFHTPLQNQAVCLWLNTLQRVKCLTTAKWFI